MKKPTNRCRALAFTFVYGEEEKKVKSFNSAKPIVKEKDDEDK